MKIIKKETFAAIFMLFLAGMANSYAQSACEGNACATGAPCAPCGEVQMNAGPFPSDANSVNPIINYTATSTPGPISASPGGLFIGANWGIGLIGYDVKIAGLGEPTEDKDSKSKIYLATFFDVGYNLIIRQFLIGIDLGYEYRSRNKLNTHERPDIVVLDAADPFNPFGFDIEIDFLKNRLDITSRRGYTADITPGFVYCRFMGYIRLGVERTSFTVENRFDLPVFSGEPPNTIVRDTNFAFSKKLDTTGFRAGAGFGIAANQNISFHFNYIHTFYRKLTFAPMFSPDVPPSIAADLDFVPLLPVTIEPHRDEFLFGVRFRF